MSNVKRRYFREISNVDKLMGYRGNPRGLVVYHINDGDLVFGYSACHPNDSFNYKDANHYANTKFNESPIVISLDNASELSQALTQVPTYMRPLVARIYAIELAKYHLDQVGNRVFDKASGVI